MVLEKQRIQQQKQKKTTTTKLKQFLESCHFDQVCNILDVVGLCSRCVFNRF